MLKSIELNEKKNKLIVDARALNDAGLNTPEQEKAYDVVIADIEQVNKDMAREAQLEAFENAKREIIETPSVALNVPKNEEARAKYAEAFESMLRTPIAELEPSVRAVLNTGTGSEGGYLVPEDYLTTVINKLLDMNVIRQNATVIRTASTTNIPLGDGRPSFAIIAENGAYPDTDASFGQVVLGAFKIGGTIKASDELIQDAFINLEEYLTNLIVEGINDAEEGYFTTGTGTGQPQGIITASALGKTTAAIAAVTADEVLDLIYSVKAVYRMNSKLMMNSTIELALLKLKDTTGQYLWQPAVAAGTPNTFNNYPILINEKMVGLGTGNKFMGFGDLRYFTIGDRGGIEIKRLNELYAANGQVGWRVSKRVDSRLTQSETFKHMINA